MRACRPPARDPSRSGWRVARRRRRRPRPAPARPPASARSDRRRRSPPHAIRSSRPCTPPVTSCAVGVHCQHIKGPCGKPPCVTVRWCLDGAVSAPKRGATSSAKSCIERRTCSSATPPTPIQHTTLRTPASCNSFDLLDAPGGVVEHEVGVDLALPSRHRGSRAEGASAVRVSHSSIGRAGALAGGEARHVPLVRLLLEVVGLRLRTVGGTCRASTIRAVHDQVGVEAGLLDQRDP